ncbi:MAG TPA: tRNA (adenosine(37)-N6)-threonylcarbamoyltransferase complex dimerization subunit type 1 TsaB [Solirubrobacterales bacterium]
MLLAIDTSTSVASVALFGRLAPDRDQTGVLAEITWRAGQRHTTQLLPRVEQALADAGAALTDLAGVGVALGPGSFNGIRVGVSTAKLLAVSLGVPLVGVSTLAATAFAFREAAALASLASGETAWIRPIDDAGRGQIATALYRAARDAGSLQPGDLVEVEPPRIAELSDVVSDAAARGGAVLVCGEVRPEWAAVLAGEAPARVVVASESAAFRRAGALAALCWKRLSAGLTDDPATLQAIYLRRPPVLERVSLPELG